MTTQTAAEDFAAAAVKWVGHRSNRHPSAPHHAEAMDAIEAQFPTLRATVEARGAAAFAAGMAALRAEVEIERATGLTSDGERVR